MDLKTTALVIGGLGVMGYAFVAPRGGPDHYMIYNRKTAHHAIERVIDADPDLELVDFGGFNFKRIRGVATSPESLERLRSVYEQAKPFDDDLELDVKLWDAWTPHFVSGRVQFPDGDPAPKVWVWVDVHKYSTPTGLRGRDNVTIAKRRGCVADENGEFEFKCLPTVPGSHVTITVAGEETFSLVDRDDIVITIDRP